jgi:hypothetical protein
MPASVILSPNDKDSNYSTIDFSNVSNISSDSDAFKRIQKFSKLTSNSISSDVLSNSSKFKKIHNLYLSTNYVDNNTSSYGTQRQHNFSSLDSTLPSFSTLVDKRSLNKFFDYTAGVGIDKYERKTLSKVLPFKTIYNANEESVVNASYKALGILNTVGSLYNYQDVNFVK